MLRSIAALGFAGLLMSQPVAAEVVKADDGGFITRETAIVEASPKQVWLNLISPARWWNSGHTWSGDAANLTITPQAGGCFCERIPEDPTSDKVTLEGSVEHMRVIHAFPEKALRMTGSLGPLQSEAVTGVLTVAMAETDNGGTSIVWEYVVGGYMRYDIPIISKAVDGVMTQQLNGLADLMGRVDVPEATPDAKPDAASEAGADPEAEAGAEDGTEDGAGEPAPDEKSDREKSLEDAVKALGEAAEGR
ncbi:MAG: SRPBCC family protein [Erythrobacter sp.]